MMVLGTWQTINYALCTAISVNIIINGHPQSCELVPTFQIIVLLLTNQNSEHKWAYMMHIKPPGKYLSGLSNMSSTTSIKFYKLETVNKKKCFFSEAPTYISSFGT